jgi:predicted ATPase
MSSSYLKTLTVKGFLSIRDQTVHLGHLNVLIGANGSGKSNLLRVFNLLQYITDNLLQLYVGLKGGANRLFHYGTQTTTTLEIKLDVADNDIVNVYSLCLVPTDNDTLVFEQETVSRYNIQTRDKRLKHTLGSGHTETRLEETDTPICQYIVSTLTNIDIFRFVDTGPGSIVRQACEIEDNRKLHEDGRNLSAFLYFLEQKHQPEFKRIERAVRRVAPFFKRFSLQPSRLNPDMIQLEWVDVNHNMHFGAAALPDGLLRFICLVTVFNQPSLPALIVLDEPELGLHPAAITYLAELLRTRAQECQILAATQSVTLVNQLDPDNVWVTDRQDGESTFKHLVNENLDPWLEAYAIGDIWEKNLIGGRP